MKEIKGYENYYISRTGDVINMRTGRKLKTSKNQKGYSQLVLSKLGKSSTKTIHRLVYEAYSGVINKGYEINHVDGNKNNNSVSNLEQVTHVENMIKAVEIGIIKSGSNCKLSKPVLQIDVITNEVIEEYGSTRLATLKTGVSGSSISNVCNGNRITAGGYKWAFRD